MRASTCIYSFNLVCFPLLFSGTQSDVRHGIVQDLRCRDYNYGYRINQWFLTNRYSNLLSKHLLFLFSNSYLTSSQGRSFDIFDQRIYPLERIIVEKRMSVLFIGAGIPNRYAGACTWTNLLESIAAKIGIDRFQLNGIKKSLESEHPDSNIYPYLASKLSSMMMDQIGSKQLVHDDFFDMSDDEWKMMEDCDPFKVLICSMLKTNHLTDRNSVYG